MKIKFTCAVDSLALIQEEVIIDYDSKRYTFVPNDQHYLSEIQLITDIKHPEKFDSTFEKKTSEDKNETLTIKQDIDLMNEIRADLQQLESLLALTHNVKRIHWDKLKYDLILETEADRKITGVTGVAITWDYPDVPRLAKPEHLYMAVATKERLNNLTVPLAFWREGLRDHIQHRYINAFYNFYFILEGFYGGGKWRNHQVADEFKNSDLANFLDPHLKDKILTDPIMSKRLTEMIDAMNVNNAGRANHTPQSLDVDGIITLIVDTRGSLLHFNLINPQGTPFNHQDYRHLELVLFYLAVTSLMMKVGAEKIPLTEMMADNLGIDPKNP